MRMRLTSCNQGGIIQTNVPAVYEQLRDDAAQMRARIGHDPVGAVGARWITKICNDRMQADRRIRTQIAESSEERVPGGELGRARRELTAKSRSERGRLVLRPEHFLSLAEFV